MNSQASASSTLRSLSLAHAAIEHALYFLEIGATDRAAGYFTYAGDRFRDMASLLSEKNASATPSASLS